MLGHKLVHLNMWAQGDVKPNDPRTVFAKKNCSNLAKWKVTMWKTKLSSHSILKAKSPSWHPYPVVPDGSASIHTSIHLPPGKEIPPPSLLSFRNLEDVTEGPPHQTVIPTLPAIHNKVIISHYAKKNKIHLHKWATNEASWNSCVKIIKDGTGERKNGIFMLMKLEGDFALEKFPWECGTLKKDSTTFTFLLPNDSLDEEL